MYAGSSSRFCLILFFLVVLQGKKIIPYHCPDYEAWPQRDENTKISRIFQDWLYAKQNNCGGATSLFVPKIYNCGGYESNI